MVRSLLLFFSGFAVAIASLAWSSSSSVYDPASVLLRTNVLDINQLHLLKIGHLAELEESIAFDIWLRMREMHVREEQGLLSKDDANRLMEMRVLLSVMQQKHSIRAWKDREDFQNRLSQSEEVLPEVTGKFECYDWKKPMWVPSECD